MVSEAVTPTVPVTPALAPEEATHTDLVTLARPEQVVAPAGSEEVILMGLATLALAWEEVIRMVPVIQAAVIPMDLAPLAVEEIRMDLVPQVAEEIRMDPATLPVKVSGLTAVMVKYDMDLRIPAESTKEKVMDKVGGMFGKDKSQQGGQGGQGGDSYGGNDQSNY